MFAMEQVTMKVVHAVQQQTKFVQVTFNVQTVKTKMYDVYRILVAN